MSIHNLCFLSNKKKKKRSILLAVINIYTTCVFLTFQYFIKKTHLKIYPLMKSIYIAKNNNFSLNQNIISLNTTNCISRKQMCI